MSLPIRLTAALTHPVQYYAPWFRHIAAHCPEIDLTVLYATQPTPPQQGVGFGVGFQWDPPLAGGYRHAVVRPARPGDSLHSDHFWGLDVPEIADAIVASRPDLALIPGWYSVTLLRAVWACRRARIPVLYRGDTHLGNAPPGWRRPAWAIRTRLLLGMYEAYLSPGTRVREYLRHFGVDRARIFDVPHCVDNVSFARAAAELGPPRARAAARVSLGLSPGDFVILFAGKLEAKKRPIDLIQAMARLRPGARLLVAGAGDLEPACRAEASRLGVSAVWAGFQNQSALGRIYAVSDCLVLPSDWGETWGLVVNEALATGLPCVVSDRVGAAPDLIVPGATGEIFAMGDIAALAAAVERVRDRESAGDAQSRAARTWVAAASVEGATAGLLDACRAVAGRAQSPDLRASATTPWPGRALRLRTSGAPAIAVVLPTYDGAAFLRESVESVLAQDIEDFELIVCDDHSADATWSMLQQYAADPRVRLLRNDAHRGLFPTLNRLVREACSQWIHLWSQDDRMLPHCLGRTLAFAAAHPEVGMIYSARHHIDEAGRRRRDGTRDLTPEVVTPLLAARIMFYFGSIAGNIANVTLRKDAFDALDGFREDLDLSGDYEYWTRLSERFPIGYQREPLIELRTHPGQLSRQRRSGARFIGENREIHDRLFLRLPGAERERALRHRRWVLQVNSFHHAVRLALGGELGMSLEVLALLRAEAALLPLAARWLLSANGRLAVRPSLSADSAIALSGHRGHRRAGG